MKIEIEKERRKMEEKRREVETKKWALENTIKGIKEDIDSTNAKQKRFADYELKTKEKVKETTIKIKEAQTLPIKRICGSCGAENKRGTKFCTLCGQKLEEQTAEETQLNTQN